MASGELATYRDYLDHYRGVIERQCADLTPEQLASRAVAPSTLSLLGLLRHLAYVEQTWFERALQGRTDEPRLFTDPSDPDHEFHAITGTQAEVDEAFALWRAQIARADAWLDGQSDATMAEEIAFNRDGKVATKREVLVHLVEEYARHAGHADLLRERIDGRTGL
jgi:uncharacterized damage-inducible protein DinB